MTIRLPFAIILLLPAFGAPVAAQRLVTGTVIAPESSEPVAGAIVRLREATAITNSGGQFWVSVGVLPDTLTVRYIGRESAAVVLSQVPAEPLVIDLPLAIVLLPDLAVIASGREMDINSTGRWRIPLRLARTVPPGIETDVLRSLSLVPSVAFTSPLSSRPLIRGYDAWESSVRVDGFEVVNPYHLGRLFSAFPAEAAADVSVTTGPFSAREGGATAGIVDISGRTGTSLGVSGGVGASLLSGAGWLDFGTPSVRGVIAARTAYLSEIPGPTSNVPYGFQDAYATASLGSPSRPVRFTTFLSRDRLFDDRMNEGMIWSNVLFGARWAPLVSRHLRVETSAHVATFDEDVVRGFARGERIDIQNSFTRAGTAVAFSLSLGPLDFDTGFQAGRRRILNAIQPAEPDSFGFLPRDLRDERWELGAFGETTLRIGLLSASAGLRVDQAGSTAVWQPRLRLVAPIGRRLAFAGGYGRTARLYHLISDPLPEPELLFFDLWRPANEVGYDVPIVDQLSAELHFRSGPLAARIGAFRSRGQGIGELRPVLDTTTTPDAQFRFGDSRTRGLEFHVSVGEVGMRASSFAATYVVSESSRRWNGVDWIPWALDRRHLVRVMGNVRLFERWQVFGLLEGASALPMTPVIQVAPYGRIDGVRRSVIHTGPHTGTGLALVYGEENRVRGLPTARLDLGARYSFTGPWDSEAQVGFSVLNLTWGPVSPLEPVLPILLLGGNTLEYRRTFQLPPVPTITFRMQF